MSSARKSKGGSEGKPTTKTVRVTYEAHVRDLKETQGSNRMCRPSGDLPKVNSSLLRFFDPAGYEKTHPVAASTPVLPPISPPGSHAELKRANPKQRQGGSLEAGPTKAARRVGKKLPPIKKYPGILKKTTREQAKIKEDAAFNQHIQRRQSLSKRPSFTLPAMKIDGSSLDRLDEPATHRRVTFKMPPTYQRKLPALAARKIGDKSSRLSRG